MSTFLLRLDPPPGDGPRLAVKDIIDIEGTPTTSASRAVAVVARPATDDAECVRRARAGGARIVGKTNLHELAFGGTGVNPFTGTPTNPLDPTRIPGGSSSGSAVAVATGEADVGFGTDTGGSIRTPAACCGIVGLKTTYGRIPLDGVHPLSPSLDTVGPLGRTVADVVAGMALLEPGFSPAAGPAALLGRFRLSGVARWIEDAIDGLLARAGVPMEPTALPGWDAADRAGSTVVFAEAAQVHARLLDQHADELGDEVRGRLEAGTRLSPAEVTEARALVQPWRTELDAALARTPVLVLAAIADEPAPLTDPLRLDTRHPNVAVNLAGHPAIAVPVPAALVDRGRLPTSLQLVAARGAEELLVATAAVLEAAAATA